ncbi:MAG: toxin-antitoxin system HicB family antitoxin [Gaiellaceae bacterium]
MAASVERVQESEPTHSGRLLLRMPRSLHAELAARSDADGVSLNQFIVAALARSVSSDAPPAHEFGGAGDASPERRPRPAAPALRYALLANAVVVALAAVTAIALLLTAWR